MSILYNFLIFFIVFGSVNQITNWSDPRPNAGKSMWPFGGGGGGGGRFPAVGLSELPRTVLATMTFHLLIESL